MRIEWWWWSCSYKWRLKVYNLCRRVAEWLEFWNLIDLPNVALLLVSFVVVLLSQMSFLSGDTQAQQGGYREDNWLWDIFHPNVKILIDNKLDIPLAIPKTRILGIKLYNLVRFICLNFIYMDSSFCARLSIVRWDGVPPHWSLLLMMAGRIGTKLKDFTIL